MKISDLIHRTRIGALGLSLLSVACIITDDDDDGGINDGGESGNPPATTGQPNTTGSVDDSGTDAGTDAGTGDEVCQDAENVVSEPGFEEGPDTAAWTVTSEVFDTVICDAGCTDEGGAEPYAGDYWVWFGGLEEGDPPENAIVEQDVTIPADDEAQLSFWFQIRSGAGTGDDVFSVDMVDGDIVDNLWMVTDLDMPSYSDQYRRIDLDVTPWADGGTYTLRFSTSIQNNGLTSFFLDEVELVACSAEAGTSTGMATEGADTTAGSTGTTGDTEGATGTSTGTGTGTGTGTTTGG